MLQGRSFLRVSDFTQADLQNLVDFALHLKDLKARGIPHPYLQGQNLALIFDKASTRTRAAFTVAASDLGANLEYFAMGDMQLGSKESVADTARVMGRMFDGIGFRGAAQEDVDCLAAEAGVPVWNALTDLAHPMQMVGDYMTLKEAYGKLAGLKLAYLGDGRNNVANSLLLAGLILGVEVAIVAPKALQPSPELCALADQVSDRYGTPYRLTEDVASGVQGADAIYTDVWVSMGEEDQLDARLDLLRPYQVNAEVMAQTAKPTIFMHCLPAYHNRDSHKGRALIDQYGEGATEVTEEVFQSDAAWQFQQAENRLHSVKAILAATNGHLFVPGG
ncbi:MULTISPECIES: ornithine carbamoyltransferase [Aerococcus]|uniref:Ornithine carbamoyltransferase n=1 Tax=Aerococcus sanguinicola TaxID=119206 RepID=A0A5N1GPJ2_9LACT|nr:MULTISPECIES: ornithine carbamoyltransferase [Aerococcus]KAA9300630.1 ornithine carbamoyltransferase [Aerococcus sanguinicola]MDK6370128.1 ornithine carbamoyltransferase [Aerococcus sp. UMB9870]MDK6680072.1 ornithine carbamoyltransferase [Aerococcus sp. UMB8608]MDK6686233.1 ornithine carbamoyltransferase [Aerococcus sp. UMB8623]MDK6939961.1 ornithine carbamoyltransferase [Aerococcus sp. UMB8487]